MPFDDAIANDLEAEFREQPFGRRFQARRKALARDAMLAVTGQSRLHLARVPAATRRLLWIYTWTTVGDAILDLAPRDLVPAGVGLELLIAPHLAPLFTGDRRFSAIHVDVADCDPGTDFVLLDSLRTSSLRLKSRHFRAVPFATMRGHQAGERFDRAAFADLRLRQLFGLDGGEVELPRLDVSRGDVSQRSRIGLALGARVPRKLYPHWPAALEALVARRPGMRSGDADIVLLGQGESARMQARPVQAALARIGVPCVSMIDSGDLGKTARDIASCSAFLGVDGGLMHVAVAVGTPGLALFTRVDPHWFLRPGSTMAALARDSELAEISPEDVAAAFADRQGSI